MRAKSVKAVAVAAVAALLGVFGCAKKSPEGKTAVDSRSHEAALGRVMTALDECNALLASLKGPEAVPGAKARIEEAVGKVSSAEKELSALPELPDEQKKALGAKYGPELDKRTARLSAQAARLRPAYSGATKSSGPVMKEAGGPVIRETAGGSGLVDKVKDKLEAAKTRIQNRLQVRKGATGPARG